MARLKPIPASVNSLVAPDVPIALSELLDGPRPTDAARDALWLALRAELFHLEADHPRFDPRVMLPLTGNALAAWREARAVWLASTLAHRRAR